MKKKALLSLLFLLFFCVQLVLSQIYVKHDAVGANDGSSWNDAYTTLQSAFDASVGGDQIWIASGEYKPTITGDTVDAYFSFNHDLSVYGGFTGVETDISQRDWEMNKCILSGDHLGDDTDGNFDLRRTDNSKHVLWLTDTITNATVLDGITFSHGNTEPSTGSGNDRRGGGILTYGAPIVRNCTFTQNYGYFGGGIYPRGSGADGIQIDNCTFEFNTGQFGAGIYVNSNTATITQSDFVQNMSVSLGAGIYNSTDDGAMISFCTFTQNSSIDSRAGGIYCTGSPSTISNCTFERNRAVTSTGAAIHTRNSDDEGPYLTTTIIDCEFDRNESQWGGALGVYDLKMKCDIINCNFVSNSSTTAGGATTNGFGANSNFINCTFSKNSSDIGGAMYNQNDSSTINVEGCTFEENSATDRGGAINISGSGDPMSTQPVPQVNISNSTFLGNSALEQAGAINMSNANLFLSSCVIALNFAINADGRGGAISLNTSDTITTDYQFLNSTFVQNSADLGAGVANWQQDETAITTLTIQNTVFDNPDGDNYAIEAGNPVVNSTGGNLSSDASLSTYFIGTNDENDTNPGFVDAYTDYHLLDNSPCVNTGIDAGAPSTDIEGNPRLGMVDKGAYENQNVVGVRNQENQSFGVLSAHPIPAIDYIYFSLENEWKGTVSTQVVSVTGQVILSQPMVKASNLIVAKIDVRTLNQGVYFLKISNGSKTSTKQLLIK